MFKNIYFKYTVIPPSATITKTPPPTAMISLQHSSERTVSRAAMFWSIWYLFVAPTRAAVMKGLETSKCSRARGGGATRGAFRRVGKESKERESNNTRHQS